MRSWFLSTLIVLCLASTAGAQTATEASDAAVFAANFRNQGYDIPASRAGRDFVRAYLKGGFGHDYPVVEIVRGGGRPPQITVYARRGPRGGSSPVRMTALITAKEAQAAFTGARQLVGDLRADEAAKAAPSDGVEICLDTPEAAIQRADHGRMDWTFKGDCEVGRLIPFAITLANLASARIAPCNLLSKPDAAFAQLVRLAECAMLRGDRFSAARFLRATHIDARGADLLALADPQVVISWDGQPQAKGAKAFRSVFDRLIKADDRHVFAPIEVIGQSQSQVLVSGQIYVEPAADNEYHTAAYRQVWGMKAGVWRLVRLDVGPFDPSLSAGAP